jgi:AraC-like DNA-binding protein
VDTRLNLYAVVLLFAFVHGMLYVILLTKRGIRDDRVSDFWLVALIAALCIFNLHWMLGFMGIHVMGQALWFFPQSVGLIVGPIVYYYLKTQINAAFRFTKRDLGHFIPFLVYFFYHLGVFLPGADFVEYWNTTVHLPLRLGDIEVVAEYTSVVVYLILSWRLYRKYQKWLPQERSDTEALRFDWYRYFLWALMLAALSALVVFVIEFWYPLSYQAIWIQRAVIAVLIYYISVTGYAQSQPRHLVFEEKPIETTPFFADLPPDSPKEGEGEKAENTPSGVAEAPDLLPKPDNRLRADVLAMWKAKIEETMSREKLYLDSELTLSQLSEKLGTHNSLISHVINNGFDKNFNDFVNEFRVNIFKTKVSDPKSKHLTLLALAFECGFNSKSTFNRAVKKSTGLLPSDFLKN